MRMLPCTDADQSVQNYIFFCPDALAGKSVMPDSCMECTLESRYPAASGMIFPDTCLGLKLCRVYKLSVAPDTFQIIKQTVFFRKYMYDNVAIIH